MKSHFKKKIPSASGAHSEVQLETSAQSQGLLISQASTPQRVGAFHAPLLRAPGGNIVNYSHATQNIATKAGPMLWSPGLSNATPLGTLFFRARETAHVVKHLSQV